MEESLFESLDYGVEVPEEPQNKPKPWKKKNKKNKNSTKQYMDQIMNKPKQNERTGKAVEVEVSGKSTERSTSETSKPKPKPKPQPMEGDELQPQDGQMHWSVESDSSSTEPITTHPPKYTSKQSSGSKEGESPEKKMPDLPHHKPPPKQTYV